MDSNLSSPHSIDNSPRIWRGKRGGRKKKSLEAFLFISIPPNDESTRGRNNFSWMEEFYRDNMYIYTYIYMYIYVYTGERGTS